MSCEDSNSSSATAKTAAVHWKYSAAQLQANGTVWRTCCLLFSELQVALSDPTDSTFSLNMHLQLVSTASAQYDTGQAAQAACYTCNLPSREAPAVLGSYALVAVPPLLPAGPPSPQVVMATP